jgi:hypothetical protein
MEKRNHIKKNVIGIKSQFPKGIRRARPPVPISPQNLFGFACGSTGMEDAGRVFIAD